MHVISLRAKVEEMLSTYRHLPTNSADTSDPELHQLRPGRGHVTTIARAIFK